MEDKQPTEDGLWEAIAAWLTYMRDVEDYAESTVTGKLQEAVRLTEWLVGQGVISTREFARDLLSEFAVGTYADLADRTHNLYMSHLRVYCAFLRRRGLLGDDQAPETELKPRRRPQSKRPKAFVYPEKLMELAQSAGRWHARDKYFLLFAYYGVRRAGEVCGMRWDAVDTTPRPRYKFGRFQFRNNKIGGELKYRPIDRLLLPHILAWREEYQLILIDQYGLDSRGLPKRTIKPTDYMFPALVVGAGMSVGGARRALRMEPTKPVPYGSIKKNLARIGIKGIHAARRGGMIGLEERFDLETAQTMADHKTPEQAAAYLDMDRKAEAVGSLFEEEDRRATKKALKKARKTAAKAGLPSLDDRRAGARRAS